MSTVVIEKYVDGICVETVRLPAAPLHVLAGLLPVSARHQLRRHGLDIEALLHDATSASDAQWMDIEEKQVSKRIRISRQD